MFASSGDRATTQGLKVVMYAMLFLAAVKIAQVALEFFRVRDLMPVVAGWNLAYLLELLVIGPLLMLAALAAAFGCWLGFKGCRFSWARQFAIGAMAFFTVAAILRLLTLAINLLPGVEESLLLFGFGSKATGLLLIGMGVYLYYLLALDAGEDFPGGLGMRGGRVLFVPLAPIFVGAFIAYSGDYYPFDLGIWIVVVAAGATAFSIYNRIPPDDVILDSGPQEKMPPEKDPMPPAV